VTVTTNIAAATDLAIHEYSGVASVNALDQNAATQRSGNSLSFNLTTQYANELLFCFGFNQSTGSAMFTPSAGWTGREQTANPSGECLKTFDQVVSSAGSYSNTLTCSSSSNGYHLLAASFSDTARATDLVQSESVGNVGTSISKAFRANNTTGNLLVLAIGAWVSSGTIPTLTVSDSAGNTWTLLDSTPTATGSGQSKAYLYYVSTCLAGANTVTVTFSVSCDSCIAIHEYASPVSSPTSSAAANAQVAFTVSSGDVTTDGTGMLFSCGYDQLSSDGFASDFTGLGWQIREGAGSTGKTGLVSFDQIAAAGTYTQSLTIPGITASQGLHAIAAAFTTAGGASIKFRKTRSVLGTRAGSRQRTH
jgi:hypothetical protein